MGTLKDTMDSVSNLADTLSNLIDKINKKISQNEIQEIVDMHTNAEFNDKLNNDHDTLICDAIRKKKQQKIEELKCKK